MRQRGRTPGHKPVSWGAGAHPPEVWPLLGPKIACMSGRQLELRMSGGKRGNAQVGERGSGEERRGELGGHWDRGSVRTGAPRTTPDGPTHRVRTAAFKTRGRRSWMAGGPGLRKFLGQERPQPSPSPRSGTRPRPWISALGRQARAEVAAAAAGTRLAADTPIYRLRNSRRQGPPPESRPAPAQLLPLLPVLPGCG